MCVSVYPYINFWMAEPIFMKFRMYIIAPGPISTAYFINTSHQSVSLYRCYKNFTGNEYRRNNRRIVRRVIFYAVGVVSRKVGD
jgi:hypothetical protein